MSGRCPARKRVLAKTLGVRGLGLSHGVGSDGPLGREFATLAPCLPRRDRLTIFLPAPD
ncbi:hypothetical protein SBV1_770035 [Verrucomicrobia bacterium]|nr:hypothetical protein SBV1_770035 [Verrucomicrobiota bacterium]